MTPVSRKRLEKETNKLLVEVLLETFAGPGSAEDAQKILNTLLTSTELEMLKKRIGIILLLNEGHQTEGIAKTIKTTRQTVSRIRLQLLEVEPKDKKYLNQVLRSISTSKKLKSLLKDIINIDLSRSSFKRKISPFYN